MKLIVSFAQTKISLSMKKILYKGQEVEAFDLLMQKENAIDILHGNKKVETRSFSPFYFSRFIDKKKQKTSKNINDYIIRQDVEFIHFHNYTNSWFLNVRINESGLFVLDKESVEIMNNDFGFHDFNNEWQQYDDIPSSQKPMFYWFSISEIVNHNFA